MSYIYISSLIIIYMDEITTDSDEIKSPKLT